MLSIPCTYWSNLLSAAAMLVVYAKKNGKWCYSSSSKPYINPDITERKEPLVQHHPYGRPSTNWRKETLPVNIFVHYNSFHFKLTALQIPNKIPSIKPYINPDITERKEPLVQHHPYGRPSTNWDRNISPVYFTYIYTKKWLKAWHMLAED